MLRHRQNGEINNGKTVAPHYVAGKGSEQRNRENVHRRGTARRAPTKPQRGAGTKGTKEKEFQSFRVIGKRQKGKRSP